MAVKSEKIELLLWFVVASVIVLFIALFYMRKKFNEEEAITLDAIRQLNFRIESMEAGIKRHIEVNAPKQPAVVQDHK